MKSLWAAIKSDKMWGSSFHTSKRRRMRGKGERAKGGDVLIEGAEEEEYKE